MGKRKLGKKAEVVEKEVVQEEVKDTPVEGVDFEEGQVEGHVEGVAEPFDFNNHSVVSSGYFVYEIKAGKGTFSGMSDEDVMEFIDATLGKVDKIVITKN